MTQNNVGIYASQISGHLYTPVGSYDALATVTVPSGGLASITFAGIPAGYRHLQLRIIGNVSTDSNLTMRVGNGSVDSGSNYSWHQLYGTGSAAGAVAGANSTQMYFASMTNAANIFGVSIIDVLDYANTSKYKTFRGLDGYDANGSGVVDFASGSWRNTSAINTLEFRCAANFNQYSSFALYGIK